MVSWPLSVSSHCYITLKITVLVIRVAAITMFAVIIATASTDDQIALVHAVSLDTIVYDVTAAA